MLDGKRKLVNWFLLLYTCFTCFSTGEIRIFFLECYFWWRQFFGRDAYKRSWDAWAIFVQTPPRLESVTNLEGPRNLVGVRLSPGCWLPRWLRRSKRLNGERWFWENGWQEHGWVMWVMIHSKNRRLRCTVLHELVYVLIRMCVVPMKCCKFTCTFIYPQTGTA